MLNIIFCEKKSLLNNPIFVYHFSASAADMPAVAATTTTTITPYPTQFLATDNFIEYITYTPGLLDHYSGETYINQPRLNIVYSNASKLYSINFHCCCMNIICYVIILIDLVILR
jgi:hypothetical protein